MRGVLVLQSWNCAKEKEAKLDLLGEPEVLGVDYWSGKGSAKRAFKKWNGVILFSLTWGIPTGGEQTKIQCCRNWNRKNLNFLTSGTGTRTVTC